MLVFMMMPGHPAFDSDYVWCGETRAHGSFRNLQLSALVSIVTQGGVLICAEGEPLSSVKVAPPNYRIKPSDGLA